MKRAFLFRKNRPVWLLALLVAILLSLPAMQVFGFTLILPPLLLNSTASAALSDGIDPNTGTSGTDTTFTFGVRYADTISVSGPGIGPITAQVHIDLDGDGVVGAMVTPFARPPWNPAPWLGALLAILLGVLLLARYSPNWRPAFSHLALALSLALVLLGCGGSGDGGGSVANASHGGQALATCTGPASEQLNMNDPGGDYTLGQNFDLTVTMNCTPGVVLFRFFFEFTGPVELTFGTRVNLHAILITP